jgi:hypothetical protein
MNASPIKRVARVLGADGSRRRILGAAVTGIAASTIKGLGRSSGDVKAAKKKRCKPKPLGAPCDSNKDCCCNTNRICSTPCTGDPGVTPTVCCGSKGAACANSLDCCSTFVCNVITGKCQEGVC